MYTTYRIFTRFLLPFVKNSQEVLPFKIWFHAASVGEVLAASPLIKRALSQREDNSVLLTVMTKTGANKALSLFEGGLTVKRFPLDVPQRLKQIIRLGKPKALIVVETELWPNLILETSKEGIPVILVNGRMGAHSFLAYKLFRKEIASLLRKFSLLLLQTDADKERFLSLGAPKEKIRVLGSLKYDVEPVNTPELPREELGYSTKDKVVVFGSVRSKEENTIIDTIKILSKENNLKMILAPRHLIRTNLIRSKLKKAGITSSLKTSGITKSTEVLILDTVGELTKFYAISDMAFVGGTLAPYGGHNLLEPAAVGIPVLFGKYTFNTEDAATGLLEFSGGFRVNNARELASAIIKLSHDEILCKKMGERAKEFLQSKRGIVERVFKEIEPFLDS